MAEKLRDLSQPIDVPLLDATVAAFYGTGSKEEVFYFSARSLARALRASSPPPPPDSFRDLGFTRFLLLCVPNPIRSHRPPMPSQPYSFSSLGFRIYWSMRQAGRCCCYYSTVYDPPPSRSVFAVAALLHIRLSFYFNLLPIYNVIITFNVFLPTIFLIKQCHACIHIILMCLFSSFRGMPLIRYYGIYRIIQICGCRWSTFCRILTTWTPSSLPSK